MTTPMTRATQQDEVLAGHQKPVWESAGMSAA